MKKVGSSRAPGRIAVKSWIAWAPFFIVLFVGVISAQVDEIVDLGDPILITETNSTKALAVPADNWNGGLPSSASAAIEPGSKVIVFLANVGLMPGESANAFRAYATDVRGTRYKLIVENVIKLGKRPWIYAVKLNILDRNGYYGQPSGKGDLVLRISWRGNTSNKTRLTSGRVQMPDPNGSIPAPAPVRSPSLPAQRQFTLGDRKRLMEQASFGPTEALDFRIRQIGAQRWIEEQFVKSYPTFPYPNLQPLPTNGVLGCGGNYGESPEINRCYRDNYWAYTNQNWFMKEALYGDDQLRRRVSWALHQIWVVSENTLYHQRWMQEYIEILDRNAFGNYRDLIREMTLSPGMGEYLDMLRSTRVNPNENYPRELLQLFTIGLDRLNPDGTLMLDENGARIPTYDQSTIDQFTKVFTGWTRCDNGANPACPNAAVGAPNYIDPMYLAVPDNHDQTAKTLLDYPDAVTRTIHPCLACFNDDLRTAYANDSLNRAIDNIFYHPNVGPFVGKLLIQHMVTSDPSPAYVERVAAAFNNNGSGVRGDMKSVIRAILLDPEARGGRKTDPSYGKLREPVQHLTNILRMFKVRAGKYANDVPATPPRTCQQQSDGVLAWLIKTVGQEILYPPNVFSYYSPFSLVPGTDQQGPEFALAHTGTSFARNNLIYIFTAGEGTGFDPPTAAEPYPWSPCGTAIDISEAIDWATADPSGTALIEGLNTKMMHGTMSEGMKNHIRTSLNFSLPPFYKAKQAVYLIASSSQYQIQR